MTKSTITREQLIKKAQEQIAFCRHTKITGEGLAHVNQCAALFEIALAAMDSDPVAWLAIYHGEVYDEAIGITRSVVEAEVDRFGWEYGLTEIIPLYRHAQTAPGDGIEAAAKWIDQQREAYDSEHGWSDPDTGAFEFGNDAQRGYSSTLEELAEGIRALHPNAGNSPVIPDTWIPVSERMPERGDYLVTDGSDFDVQMFNGEEFIPGFVWEDKITHWMPLPAAPQEVK